MTVKNTKILVFTLNNAEEAVLIDLALFSFFAAKLDLLVAEQFLVFSVEVVQNILRIQKRLGVVEQYLVIELALRVAKVVDPGGNQDILVLLI